MQPGFNANCADFVDQRTDSDDANIRNVQISKNDPAEKNPYIISKTFRFRCHKGV